MLFFVSISSKMAIILNGTVYSTPKYVIEYWQKLIVMNDAIKAVMKGNLNKFMLLF